VGSAADPRRTSNSSHSRFSDAKSELNDLVVSDFEQRSGNRLNRFAKAAVSDFRIHLTSRSFGLLCVPTLVFENFSDFGEILSVTGTGVGVAVAGQAPIFNRPCRPLHLAQSSYHSERMLWLSAIIRLEPRIVLHACS
jgi:hypothetical protein